PIDKRDNPLIREWGLEGKFVLGYSGNMGHVHEFKTMIDAAEKLNHVNEIAFVFIGDGIARQWLVSEAARRGLKNTQFYPYQSADRLRWSLSLPDVHFVSLRPTLEGLIVPSKFYGIAAAGRPIIHIGDPDGEIARILDRERCGWSFCIGEVETLTNCVLRLSQRSSEVIEAGLRARRVFDRKYSRLHALDSWRLLLESAAPVVPAVDVSVPEASDQSIAVGRK
ncbi:MAG TPA: hypothetical protein PKB10_14060, partial [Tepidisphaeraceae bacterium]|nr:hypothetical protein [Tepidisphaeraceae bacterium]